MNPLDTRDKIIEYLRAIIHNPSNLKLIIHNNLVPLRELSLKLTKKLDSEKQIDEYLNFVISEIDNLNKYFKKRKAGRIPYSKLLVMANNEKRIGEFILDNTVSKEASKIAGYKEEIVPEIETLDISVYYKLEEYFYIYSNHGLMFFFSPITREIVVQCPNGKILPYKAYKTLATEGKELGYVPKMEIYRNVKKYDPKNNAMIAFEIAIRQARERIERRKLQKGKSFS